MRKKPYRSEREFYLLTVTYLNIRKKLLAFIFLQAGFSNFDHFLCYTIYQCCPTLSPIATCVVRKAFVATNVTNATTSKIRLGNTDQNHEQKK